MTLNDVGNFLKEHGVAITLVFLYLLWIYPKQVQERKEWLTEVTLLNEALDPLKRQVTQDQALLILDLATESYVQAIESEMYNLGVNYTSAGYGWSSGTPFLPLSGDVQQVAIIFNQAFSFDLASSKESQAENIIKEYYRLAEKQKVYIKQNALQVLTKAIASARFATSGLRSFNYGNKKLSEYWESAFSQYYKQFQEDIMKAYQEQVDNGSSKDELIRLLQSENIDIPESLLEVKEYDHPSTIMYEFKMNLKKKWIAETKDNAGSSSLFESLKSF